MSSQTKKWIPPDDYIEGLRILDKIFEGEHFFVTCKANSDGEPKVSTFVAENILLARAGDGKSLYECLNWMQSPHPEGTRSIGIIPHKNRIELLAVDIDNGVKDEDDLSSAVICLTEKLGSKPVAVIPSLKPGRGHAFFLSAHGFGNAKWDLNGYSGEIRSNAGYVVLYDSYALAEGIYRNIQECDEVNASSILMGLKKLEKNTGRKLSDRDRENPNLTMLDGSSLADLAKEDPEKLIALTLATPKSGETPGLDYEIGDPEAGRNNAVYRAASYIARSHGYAGERYVEALVSKAINKWGRSGNEWVKSAESGYNRGASYYSDRQVSDKIFEKQVAEFLRKAKGLPGHPSQKSSRVSPDSRQGSIESKQPSSSATEAAQNKASVANKKAKSDVTQEAEQEVKFERQKADYAIEKGQILFYDVRHDDLFPTALESLGIEHRYNCRLDKVEFKRMLQEAELPQHIDSVRNLWSSSDQIIRQIGFAMQGAIRIVKKTAKNKEALVQLQPRIDSLKRCHELACATGVRYDPVIDYFESCEIDPNGIDYSQIFQEILGAEDTEVTRWASRHLVLSVAARSLEFSRSGSTIHARQSIMLIDPDGGSGKGVLLRGILPRHLRAGFYAQNLDLSEPPGTIAEIVGGRMIVEWTEGKGWLTTRARRQRVTDEDVKAFMDRQDDGPRRKAYGRVPENFPRLATIVVTTNNTSPMPDDKALRDRFVQIHVDPVELNDQVSNYHRIKRIITDNREHWWAQAYAESKSFGSDIELGLPDNLRKEVWQDNLQSRFVRNEDSELRSLIMLGGWENKTTEQIAADLKLRLARTAHAQLKAAFDSHAKICYAIKRIVPGPGINGKSRRVRYGTRDNRKSEYRWVSDS